MKITPMDKEKLKKLVRKFNEEQPYFKILFLRFPPTIRIDHTLFQGETPKIASVLLPSTDDLDKLWEEAKEAVNKLASVWRSRHKILICLNQEFWDCPEVYNANGEKSLTYATNEVWQQYKDNFREKQKPETFNLPTNLKELPTDIQDDLKRRKRVSDMELEKWKEGLEYNSLLTRANNGHVPSQFELLTSYGKKEANILVEVDYLR